MGQHTGQVLNQARADLIGKCPRARQFRVELRCGARQAKGFEARRIAGGILTNEHEVAEVGGQHLPVALPVAGHLVAGGGQPSVVHDGLYLDDAALRFLAPLRLALLHLPGGVQSEVGMTGALVCQVLHAEHLGPERPSHGVQQVGQRHVEGSLVGGASRAAHQTQVGEVRLYGLFQLPIGHGVPSVYTADSRQGCYSGMQFWQIIAIGWVSFMRPVVSDYADRSPPWVRQICPGRTNLDVRKCNSLYYQYTDRVVLCVAEDNPRRLVPPQRE